MPEKIRDMLGASSMILLMVAVIILGLGIKNMLTVRPASAYEDKGVHTFTPVEIYPVQKKNTSSYGRSRRMNPTTTVYKVRYEATDGSGYRCSREAGSTETSAQLLAAEGDIERRVLYVRDESVTVSSLWLFQLPEGKRIRSPFSSRSYTFRLLGSHLPCSSMARMVSITWQ